MPSYNYSSSSGSSRSSSSSSAEALARELGGLSINQKKAPSYDPKYSEPRRTLQSTTPKYESTLITPDTSRSRTKSTYGEPVIRDKRKACPDERRSKTSDSRYHNNSFPDAGVAYATPSRREDARYYPKSSYYLSERR